MDYIPKIIILGKKEKEARSITQKFEKYILSNFNANVDTFASGKKVLQNLEELDPDLIISEWNSDDDMEKSLCRSVKNIDGYQDIYFILISNKNVNLNQIDCWEEDIDGVLEADLTQKTFLVKIKPFMNLVKLEKKLQIRDNKLEKVYKENYKYKQRLEYKSKRLLDGEQELDEALDQVSNMAQKLKTAHSRIKRLKKERKKDLENFIDVVAILIYKGNKSARKHGTKVSKLSRYIAQKMGLEEELIDDIEKAARLHEVGSYNVSKAIKNKDPANYTVSEDLIMTRQPLKGSQLLSKYLGEDSDIVKIVRHYNEHVDGSGFPDNLNGSAIPIGSRIISAVDFVEESRVKYDKDIEKIVQDLESGSGEKFDHEVVSILKNYILTKYKVGEEEKAEEIQISELESGMVLAEDIYTKSGVKLIPKNSILDEDKIETLIKYSKIDPLEDNIYVKRHK